jgi:hypothetical protein
MNEEVYKVHPEPIHIYSYYDIPLWFSVKYESKWYMSYVINFDATVLQYLYAEIPEDKILTDDQANKHTTWEETIEYFRDHGSDFTLTTETSVYNGSTMSYEPTTIDIVTKKLYDI